LLGLLYVLSKNDDRFKDSVDQKTTNLFIAWFFVCILTTITHVSSVANIAHAAGGVFGLLVGYAIVMPQRRVATGITITACLMLGFLGATVARPFINFSSHGGYEEGRWGYDALSENRNSEAVSWFSDAVRYQPKEASYWFDLGIAYQRLNENANASAAYQRAFELEPTNPAYAQEAAIRPDKRAFQ
jgi:tetratricopeptide (TPR) repeat protein